MSIRRYWVSLAIALASAGWAGNSFAAANTTPKVEFVTVAAQRREPVVGVGFHPATSSVRSLSR